MIISEDEDGNLIVNDCNICYHKNCHSNDNECHAEILQLRYQKDNIVEHQVQSGSLKDFCSNKNHMIPSLLVNCVNALDKNRLDFQGIYRIPGQGSQVQKLLKELKGSKEIVNLDEYATETITGCIKAFLKEIRDPLIPPYLFEDFYQACDSELDFKIHDAILKLPKPHQDTLIYMFGHWNRVVTNSEKNLMTLENLAYCLAPTAVGIYMEKDIKIDAMDTLKA
uniref:Rho-GAP domain-containing protein n=1 Tax=Acrobeloides nanus TaxID=290746 RepID=A0A914CEP9_9BILA